MDPLRPQCHLMPARNWMNDPNGPIYWKGRYHMFFQYNPNAAVWGDMHWAHAVSEDMIHWRHLPIALAPTPGGDDADGCFTGSAVDDHGTATFLYTGVKSVEPSRATLRDGSHNFREVQCLATSKDPQLRTWNKWNQPVLQPPDDAGVAGFRDPFLWKDAETWYMGIGSGVFKEGGRVLLYRSKNLREWKYLHPLASGEWTGKDLTNPVDSGEMWECPDFFPLGKKHVLLYATAGQVIWESGELDPRELLFHREKRGLLDAGAYYAQKTQLDAKGNRILWGWVPEKRSEAEFSAAGWAGCMALPRTLGLSANGELEMTFAPETRELRGKVISKKASLATTAAELEWNAAGPFALTLSDKTGPWLTVAQEGAGSESRVTVNGQKLPGNGSSTAKRKFHVFVDASVAEVICDQKRAITARIYKTPEGPLHLAGTDAREVTDFAAWELRPISPNRLTS